MEFWHRTFYGTAGTDSGVGSGFFGFSMDISSVLTGFLHPGSQIFPFST